MLKCETVALNSQLSNWPPSSWRLCSLPESGCVHYWELPVCSNTHSQVNTRHVPQHIALHQPFHGNSKVENQKRLRVLGGLLEVILCHFSVAQYEDSQYLIRHSTKLNTCRLSHYPQLFRAERRINLQRKVEASCPDSGYFSQFHMLSNAPSSELVSVFVYSVFGQVRSNDHQWRKKGNAWERASTKHYLQRTRSRGNGAPREKKQSHRSA